MNKREMKVPPIKVTAHWALKVLYAVGVILCSSLAIATWFNVHSRLISFVLGTFAFLGIYVFLLSFTTLQVDENSLTVISLHGVYQIGWTEIMIVERTAINDWRPEESNITFAFIGKNKCLPINLSFTGTGREDCFRFIQKQIAQRQIETKLLSSKWLRPQNTRISHLRFW